MDVSHCAVNSSVFCLKELMTINWQWTAPCCVGCSRRLLSSAVHNFAPGSYIPLMFNLKLDSFAISICDSNSVNNGKRASFIKLYKHINSFYLWGIWKVHLKTTNRFAWSLNTIVWFKLLSYKTIRNKIQDKKHQHNSEEYLQLQLHLHYS